MSNIRSSLETAVFQTASYFTYPACKSHECFRRIQVVDALNPTANAICNLIRKIFLFIALLGCAVSATITSLPGMGLRFLGSHVQKEPFLHDQTSVEPKSLPDDYSFSLLSWNICCVGGGYAISDGGVMPWSFRIDNVINKIVKKNADVVCLYETFDFDSGRYIKDKLKQSGYSEFYWNIGPNAVGVSSGILVASKYKIKNPQFLPFPAGAGRAAFAKKGAFAFDLESGGRIFTRIYATHLQHSEKPAKPDEDGKERSARTAQVRVIVDDIDRIRAQWCTILTGDLNLDDDEYNRSWWSSRFNKGTLRYDGHKTWGGDEWCAKLVKKEVSGPLNLDHTMVVRGTATSITTSLVKTGYDPTVFKAGALSDHCGLLSKIYL